MAFANSPLINLLIQSCGVLRRVHRGSVVGIHRHGHTARNRAASAPRMRASMTQVAPIRVGGGGTRRGGTSTPAASLRLHLLRRLLPAGTRRRRRIGGPTAFTHGSLCPMENPHAASSTRNFPPHADRGGALAVLNRLHGAAERRLGERWCRA